MIEFIKNWAEGIVIAVIIATILEMLLPDNKSKKYISTVIGIYILFSIISPIISKFTGQSINLKDYSNKDTSLSTSSTMYNIALLESASNVEDVYIKTLKSDITDKLKSKGYFVNFIDLKVNTSSKSNYGEIEGIYLKLSLLEDKNNINNVNEIKINLSENSDNSKNIENFSEEDLNNIKKFLVDTYGISEDKIHINKEWKVYV